LSAISWAVDGLDQPEAGHLQQIFERFPCAGVATGQLPRERQEAGYQLIARAAVSVLLPSNEKFSRIGTSDS
jgi:hypothetical protein